MKVWEVDYEGHKVKVENTYFNGEKLFVDDELQDERIGIYGDSRLFGCVKNKKGEDKQIKVSIGGFFTVHCSIFIDNKLVFQNKKY